MTGDITFEAALELRRQEVRIDRRAKLELDAEEALKLWLPPQSASLDAFLASDIPPLRWAIDGLQAVGHNVLLAAQFKAGKTTLGLNLVRSLASGEPFLGREVAPPDGRIAYLNYEVDERQIKDVVGKIGFSNADRIEVLNLRGRRLPLYATIGYDWMVKWLREHEIAYVIMDPAARAIVGWPKGNGENDNDTIGDVTDTLDRIMHDAEADNLVVVHHTGRAYAEPGAEHGRGASRWDDWADVRWLLARSKSGRLTKGQHGHEVQTFFYAEGRGVNVHEHGVEFDPATWRIKNVSGDRFERRLLSDAEAVVTAVEEVGEGETTSIVRAAIRGVRADRQAQAIQHALGMGMVRREKQGRSQLIFLGDGKPKLALIAAKVAE